MPLGPLSGTPIGASGSCGARYGPKQRDQRARTRRSATPTRAGAACAGSAGGRVTPARRSFGTSSITIRSAIRLISDVDDGDQHRDRLHERDVAVLDGDHELRADARVGEHVLDDDDAADQPLQVLGEHLHARRERVAQRVAAAARAARRARSAAPSARTRSAAPRPCRRAPCGCRPRASASSSVATGSTSLVGLVERAGARRARSRPAAASRSRRRRLPTSSEPITNSGSEIAASEPSEIDVVGQRARVHGGEHPEPERERDHQQRRDRREDHRVLDRVRDQRPDRRALRALREADRASRRDRRARARRASPCTAAPAGRSRRSRWFSWADGRRVAVPPQHDARGVARQELGADEDHDRGDEQRRRAPRPGDLRPTNRSTGDASAGLNPGARPRARQTRRPVPSRAMRP